MITLNIDLSKTPEQALVFDTESSAAYTYFTALTLGDVVDVTIILSDNGLASDLNGDSDVSLSVSLGKVSQGVLALETDWTANAATSFTGTFSLNTLELQTALGSLKSLLTNLNVKMTNSATAEAKTILQKEIKILNTFTNGPINPLSGSGYYTKDETNALFVTFNSFANSTASIQEGHGIVVGTNNKVHVATSLNYSPGMIVYAPNTSALSGSTDMTFTQAVGSIQSRLMLHGDITGSGFKADLSYLDTAVVRSLTVTDPFSASYALTTLKCQQLQGNVINAGNATVMTFDGSTPVQNGTGSIRNRLNIFGNPAATNKPTLGLFSTDNTQGSMELKIDTEPTGAYQFARFSINTGSAGSTYLAYLQADLPISASLVSSSTINVDGIQSLGTLNQLTIGSGRKTGITLKNGNIGLGLDVYPNPAYLITISGSGIPHTSSVYDWGSSDRHWKNVYADNLIGTATNAINAQTASLLQSSNLAYGVKTLANITPSYTNGLTVNMGPNSSCFAKIVISGVWNGNGPIGYATDLFIQKGDGVTGGQQPGVIVNRYNNNSSGGEITAQIVDPGLGVSSADFVIRFKIDNVSTPITGAVVTWQIMGQFNSVT